MQIKAPPTLLDRWSFLALSSSLVSSRFPEVTGFDGAAKAEKMLVCVNQDHQMERRNYTNHRGKTQRQMKGKLHLNQGTKIITCLGPAKKSKEMLISS